MKILFLGGLFPKVRLREFKNNSISGLDNASNNLQSALLDGLNYYYPKIKVVTLPNICSYPFKYKKPKISDSLFSHNSKSIDYCVGFVNIPLIKHISKYRNCYKKICELIEIEDDAIIFIYGIHSPFLKAIYELKKTRPNFKTCLIVPDLPQFMSESRNIIYRFLKYLDSIVINRYLKRIDSFVLLNDNMLDFIDVGKRPWVRVEGIFNSTTTTTKSKLVEKETNKAILYTGNIDERYGIKTLLDAFDLIEEKNYRLWIRGNGNTKNFILESTKNDSRIKYFEEMSREELLDLQKKATVLINPLPTNEEFSKYNFPSKIIDYLASGTPTISTKLLSIPEDYYNHIYFAEQDDPKGLKETILKVCNKNQSELDDFGKKASSFIFENKNSRAQVKIISEMIDKL